MNKKLLALGLIFCLTSIHNVLPATYTHASLTALFQEIYQKNKKTHAIGEKADQQLRIPLKIHQIWIGPKPLPAKFKWLMETWQKFHPDWEYKLWTNEDLKDFPFINRAAFDGATNWGMKADILRYEILYYYGGLYVDLDFECIKPFDSLNYSYDLYTGLLSPHEIANGLIAAAPGSASLLKAIGAIKQYFQTAQMPKNGDNMGVINATGPVFFTNVIADYYQSAKEEDRENIMVFPVPYFYALPNTRREEFWKGQLSRENVLAYVQPESMGIHYWATSWMT